MPHESETFEKPVDDHDVSSEKGIELVAIKDKGKEDVKCFICKNAFNSRFNLEEHLSAEHNVDRELLKDFMKDSSNRTGMQ